MSKVIAVHQPNFLPWIGYFHKIVQSDIFVIIDEVQFVKGSVCNRNKIKSRDGEGLLITVPVKLSKGFSQTFRKLEIAYEQNWDSKMLNLISNSYGNCKFFDEYYSDLSKILTVKYENLAALNITLIRYLCDLMNIQTPFYYQSEIEQNLGKKNQLHISLCKLFNADTYLSGQGAKKYNDANLFSQHGISLVYQDFTHPVYPQLNGEFISHLSLIDFLFNCGVNEAEKVIKNLK